MREGLSFLADAEPGREPRAALKALFALYGEIDRNAEYIHPGEREFFPGEPGLRTLERFLEGFRYVYWILKRAQERLWLVNAFTGFWDKCSAYLGKCGYAEKNIALICSKEGIFYRRSFAFWRTEFGDSEEGLGVMYEYFRACFGIVGNDDYCRLGSGSEATYDWRRMKHCRRKMIDEGSVPETPYAPPVWEEWSEGSRERLRRFVESCRKEEEAAAPGPAPEADMVLMEIRRRNREKGLFQRPT